MEWKKKLNFAIETNLSKVCDVYATDGSKCFSIKADSSEQLKEKLVPALQTWGAGTYTFKLRTATSAKHEEAVKFTQYCGADEPQAAASQGSSIPGVPGMYMNAQVIEHIKAEVTREVSLTERERRLLEGWKELEDEKKKLEAPAGKLGIVLEKAVMPQINKILQKNNVVMNSPAGKAAAAAAEQIEEEETLQNNENLLPENWEEMTEEEQKYYQAVALLTRNVDADTLLLFAHKIHEKPQLIETLKALLPNA